MKERWRKNPMVAQLKIERVIEATPDEVFSAWTEADQLKQ
jgi:uncharacterized protein YndB with AHSA1/START domain